jgi:chromosome segregation ATPase
MMNTMKTGFIALVVVSLGLGIGLLARHLKADEEVKAARKEQQHMAVQLEEARRKADEHSRMASFWESTLAVRARELNDTSNALAKVSAELAKAQQDARLELAKRDVRIAALEGQRDDLSKNMDILKSAIADLEVQITDTKTKLATSEGDRAFLLKELDRLQAERTELVRQFNDLAILRAQVAKLKEEAAVAQRLEWMQKGVYVMQGRKGAESLLSRVAPASFQTERKLKVEIHQTGEAKAAEPDAP